MQNSGSKKSPKPNPMEIGRISNIEKTQAAIAFFEDRKNTKKLEGRSRLNAALLVSQLFKSARNLGKKRDEINQVLEGELSRQLGLNSFKINKWSLPDKISEVDHDLIAKRRDNPEPYKKRSVYFIVVRVLADLVGENALERQIELINVAGLTDVAAKRLTLEAHEIEPVQRLSEKLNIFAGAVARDGDLAGIVTAAQRLQVGWNVFEGPDPVFLDKAIQPFRASTPANIGFWNETELPPFPSVNIATVPFLGWETTFNIYPSSNDPSPKERQEESSFATDGRIIGYQDLHLVVAPSGAKQVAAFFLVSHRLKLSLNPTGSFAGAETEFTGDILGNPISFFGVDVFMHEGVPFQANDGSNWSVDANMPEVLMNWEEPQEYPEIGVLTTHYQNWKRSGTDKAEKSRSFDGSYELVSPNTVADWLFGDHILALSDMIVRPEYSPFLKSMNTDHTVPTWNRGANLAHELEISLSNHLLENTFKSWINDYRSSLEIAEIKWKSECQAEDNRLKKYWRNTDENLEE